MKIIKKGKKPFETMKFACTICACVFEADYAECKVGWTFETGNFATCNCPECNSLVRVISDK
jgi:hypothetical protein